MNPFQKIRLARFVNRHSEINSFCEMLDSEEHVLKVVYGDQGMGKSLLLTRMEQECEQRNLRKINLVWTKTRSHDYMGIMRKIRNDICKHESNKADFNAFTDMINYYTDPNYEQKIDVTVNVEGDINVAKSAQISDSNVGNVAGVIIDKMIVQPRSNMDVPKEELVCRLTDQFLENLRTVVASEPIVLLFDDIDMMSSDTEQWLWDELLGAVMRGDLTNVKFVLFSKNKPELTSDWREWTRVFKLSPLNLEHVMEYIAKRDIDEAIRADLATKVMEKTKGITDQVALFVDNFVELQKQQV